MKYLFKDDIKRFRARANSDLKLNKWKIYNNTIKERYEMVKDYSYFKQLQANADVREISYNDTEIISWLDTQCIMLRIIKEIEYREIETKIFDRMTLIQEYHIPFTNNQRADYLLIKDDKILIIEFSYDKKYRNSNDDYRFHTKLNQVINYKEVLSNILPKNIAIGTYTFIIYPEEETPNINEKGIESFVDYIEYFFSEHKISACEILENLFK